MVDGAKQLSQSGIIASDWQKSLFPLITTRRIKIFVYIFVFAFIAFTAFLAFCPSGSNASPWFNSFFTSSSSTFAPYRSHFNSLLSVFFPNSHSPSPERAISSQEPKNQTGIGVGSRGNAVSGTGSVGNAVFGKNQTETEVGSEGNGVSEKGLAEKGVGSKKDGVLVGKNQTGSGVASMNPVGNGVSAKNQTVGKDGSHKDDGLVEKKQTGSGVTSMNPVESGVSVKNQTVGKDGSHKDEGLVEKKQTESGVGLQGNGVSEKNQTENGAASKGSGGVSENKQKDPIAGSRDTGVSAKNQTAGGVAVDRKESGTPATTEQKGASAGATNSLMKGNGSVESASNSNLMGCDIFQGRWVRDESYPLYEEGSCPHIDEPFDCYRNGRPDRAYQKLRWQPLGCHIPRLNATDMLERLRGKRLVFVGDSLNRNMWQSLVCVLRNSVKNKNGVYEASGKREFKTEGSYSFLFKDYGCTVEFFRSPFLVQEWNMPGNNGTTKETLRLDIVETSASKYKDAHFIIFNTGHWWTHEKTSKGRDYYQEGNHIYSELNVSAAFHKALNTWAKWVDANVNPKKTLVFFRGYSASHFSGGQWNSGGQCDKETEPIKNEAYLSSYPPKMSILEKVIDEMKTPVSYLNITRMTDYRKDAHPSIYRKQNLTDEEKRSPESFQDCSHWCLPGVPESWNELLYALILIKQHH